MFEKYSADNPVNKKRMSAAFAFGSLSHIIASFFGSGLLRPGPGTWGTLAGWIVFVLLMPWITPTIGWAVVIVSFVIGAWASQKTSDDLGVPDHGSIVIDEVFAIWAVLLTVPATLEWQIAAFVAFRVFDIVKFPPASWCDRNLKNGWGIMIDDALAAVYAVAVLAAAQHFLA
ncbi:MAG: phosphatidylglycerophosphatase A [Burkholderiaceae bacterium]|nr:phosphatidylglycerophosphatase A [Burkholderiaceae bacterium]